MNSRDKNLVIARSVVDQGMTPAQAAVRFGVTRQWVHVLVQRYEAEGPQGLRPRSRAPRSRPATTPASVRERVVALRRQLSASGADAGPETICGSPQIVEGFGLRGVRDGRCGGLLVIDR